MPRNNRRHNRARNNRRHHHSRSGHIRPPQWHDSMMDMLIDERRRRNDFYHNTYGRSR